MDFLERKGLSQDERFQYATVLALVTSVVVGILIGIVRNFIDSSLWIILIGYAVAFMIRRYGRGVQTRFAVLGLLMTLLGLLLSDVVFAYGILGLLNLENYSLVLSFALVSDATRLTWVVTRSVCLFISYSYSRVV